MYDSYFIFSNIVHKRSYQEGLSIVTPIFRAHHLNLKVFMASPSFKLGTNEYNIERPRDGSFFGTPRPIYIFHTNLPCNFLYIDIFTSEKVHV